MKKNIFKDPRKISNSSKQTIISIKKMNDLFNELMVSKLVFFYGSSIINILSSFLCVQELSSSKSYPDSAAIFIDGGYVFDPYQISEISRLFSLNPTEVLGQIWISRAFTAYQMTALITDKLSEIVDRENPRIIVISDITSLYCDSQIGIIESRRTFNRVTFYLQKLARKKDLTILVTSLSSKNRRKQNLENYLLGRSEVVVRIQCNLNNKILLEKHPFKAPISFKLFIGEQVKQKVLEEFVLEKPRDNSFQGTNELRTLNVLLKRHLQSKKRFLEDNFRVNSTRV